MCKIKNSREKKKITLRMFKQGNEFHILIYNIRICCCKKLYKNKFFCTTRLRVQSKNHKFRLSFRVLGILRE